jgi:hypothetical protein
VTSVIALLTFCLPALSPSNGVPSEITFALAWQDRPSGIYLNREFDWPTGEAIWIDVPVWALQLVAMAGMLGSLVVYFRAARR